MLTKTNTEASIVVCNTCRYSSEARENSDGVRGGVLLRDALKDVLSETGAPDLIVEEMPCLFACSQHCTVHLRAAGKVSYVLGGFDASKPTAEAIVEFFRHYIESEHGYVPYKLWPDGVKGHFITRSPPMGYTVSSD